jgi:PleD family two-component response regulator
MSEFTVVLIDDDEDEHLFFDEALKSLKVDLTYSCYFSAKDFIKAFKENAPSIIFLDINLPKENGFTILKKLRADIFFCTIPIVMYSTSDNPDDVDKSYKSGADLYFVKEETIQRLAAKIQLVFDHFQKGKIIIRESFLNYVL